MPRSRRIEFLLYSKPDKMQFSARKRIHKTRLESWLKSTISTLQSNPHETSAKANLKQVCKMVIRRMKAWVFTPFPKYRSNPAPFSNEVLTSIVNATFQILDDGSWFLDAFVACAAAAKRDIYHSAGKVLLRYDSMSEEIMTK